MRDLLQKASDVTVRARACGALVSIDTDQRIVSQGGIDFAVRIARNLDRRKQAPAAAAGVPVNPFLPYDRELWVANVGTQHAVLLNKFNVIDNHLLIITRHYEEQQLLLTDADLAALIELVAHHGGLGFFNGGSEAGASQHHKHLQWIPGIELQGKLCVPVEAHLHHVDAGNWQMLEKPFPMALATLDHHREPVTQFTAFYRDMTRALGIDTGAVHASRPYNLLLTSRHLWIVPRTRERFESVSLNAMAFAGSLFVSRPEQLALLQQHGPLTALRHTAALQVPAPG
jgi:ATP adenylyltransferase